MKKLSFFSIFTLTSRNTLLVALRLVVDFSFPWQQHTFATKHEMCFFTFEIFYRQTNGCLKHFFSINIDYYRILLAIKLAHKCGTSFISHWNMCLAAGVTSTKAKFLFFSQPSLVPEYYNSGFLGPSKVLIKTHGLQTRPRHNRLRKFNSVKNSLYLQQSEQQLNSRVLINNTVILFLSRCNIIQIAQFIFKAELQKLPAYGLPHWNRKFSLFSQFSSDNVFKYFHKWGY